MPLGPQHITDKSNTDKSKSCMPEVARSLPPGTGYDPGVGILWRSDGDQNGNAVPLTS